MNSDNPLHTPVPIPDATFDHLTGVLHYPAKYDQGRQVVTVPGYVYGALRRKKARLRTGKLPRLPRSARKGAAQ